MHASETAFTHMKNSIARPLLPLIACLPLLLAGCGGLSIWPFDGDRDQGRPRVPPNATEYRCSGGKSFYLRFLDNSAAWVIFPEREFRLDKLASGAGTRFSNGIATLEISGNEANLTDGPSSSFSNCAPAGKARG
jgi:membrane-bound inhibitor of C-type lysozyme